MFPIPTLYNKIGNKISHVGYGQVNKEKTCVCLEAEVRLIKMDNVHQVGLNNVRSEARWKICSIIKYEMNGCYYIKVFLIYSLQIALNLLMRRHSGLNLLFCLNRFMILLTKKRCGNKL